MAFARGIVQIKEVELDDGIWEVEGLDAGGPKIEDESRREKRRASSSSSATIRRSAPCFRPANRIYSPLAVCGAINLFFAAMAAYI